MKHSSHSRKTFVHRVHGFHVLVIFALLLSCMILASSVISWTHINGLHVSNLLFSSTSTTQTSPPESLEEYFKIWEKSFYDPALLASAPYGMILVPFMKRLNDLQNPVDCSLGSYLLYDQSINIGFGATIKHLTLGFYMAARTGRILVFDNEKPYYWSAGCPEKDFDGSLECFFLPLSKCSPDIIKVLIKKKRMQDISINASSPKDIHDVPIIPIARPENPSVVRYNTRDMGMPTIRKIAESLPKQNDAGAVVRELLGSGWNLEIHERFLSPERRARQTLQFILSSYIMRLNSRTADIVSKNVTQVLRHSGLTGKDAHHVVGVPVRKSDKCKGEAPWGEIDCVNATVMLDAAWRMAMGHGSITHIILTSEDPSAIEPGVENNLEGWLNIQIVRNYLDKPSMSGSEYGLRSDMPRAEILASGLVTMFLQAFA